MTDMATGPVCGMAVERQAAPNYRYDGQTYYFCSSASRDEFTAAPDHFPYPSAAAGV
jgi:YHS domain-containing protein